MGAPEFGQMEERLFHSLCEWKFKNKSASKLTMAKLLMERNFSIQAFKLKPSCKFFSFYEFKLDTVLPISYLIEIDYRLTCLVSRICDSNWEKDPFCALFQNRVIATVAKSRL